MMFKDICKWDLLPLKELGDTKYDQMKWRRLVEDVLERVRGSGEEGRQKSVIS